METQHTAYRRFRSIFGMASVFGIKVQNEVGQHLRSEFSRSVFMIEIEIEFDRI